MRKSIRYIVASTMLLSCSLQAEQRKVLIEMFTNSHCISCVPAYEFFRSFASTNPAAGYTSDVFYHIAQPGVEDSLYIENAADPDGRNLYYGPYTGLPILFVDGTFYGSNLKTWEQGISSRSAVSSPFVITLSGSISGQWLSVQTSVMQTSNVSQNDLALYVVGTEDVISYVGKNGVSPLVGAMRIMITGPRGESFKIAKGQTKVLTYTIRLDTNWDTEHIFIVAFIQSKSTKEVFQSERISATMLVPTDVETKTDLTSNKFALDQNYPNPFNPTTHLRFTVPKAHQPSAEIGDFPPEADAPLAQRFVSLKIYDVLGREVVTLVNETMKPGTYSVEWNASRFASGVYYYQLCAHQKDGGQAGNFVSVKKMVLIK